MTDERLKELYEIEKAKQSPDNHVLFSIASEQKYRNRDAIVEQALELQRQTLKDVGATMQDNIRKAAETKALFIPVVKE